MGWIAQRFHTFSFCFTFIFYVLKCLDWFLTLIVVAEVSTSKVLLWNASLGKIGSLCVCTAVEGTVSVVPHMALLHLSRRSQGRGQTPGWFFVVEWESGIWVHISPLQQMNLALSKAFAQSEQAVLCRHAWRVDAGHFGCQLAAVG